MSRFERARDGQGAQALLRTGFATLPHCRYLLLQIRDPASARGWIRRLLTLGLVKSVNDVGRTRGAAGEGVGEAVTLAFSYQGLQRLDVRESADFPFPTAFRAGMASPARANLLRDCDTAAWDWRDIEPARDSTEPARVDILLAHFRCQPFDAVDAALDPARLDAWGVAVVQVVASCPYYTINRVEPFGFRDGIAQPHVPGVREGPAKGRATPGAPKGEFDNVVPAGEFLLGRLNAYGESSYSPDAVGWRSFVNVRTSRFGDDGSYLVVRQIAQDLEAFHRFDPALKSTAAPSPPTPGESLIGRRRSGEPLLCPSTADIEPDLAGRNFGFRAEDPEGFACPRGAHIRRANPRDGLGWDMLSGVVASKLHRLIRVGRVYTTAPACGGPAQTCATAGAQNCGAGLFFMALNADLDRQFEFIQQRWIASSKFADLWDEDDPLLGARAGRCFSAPDYRPVGRRFEGLDQFTTVRAGGYFFLPSLKALEFIGRTPAALNGDRGHSAPLGD